MHYGCKLGVRRGKPTLNPRWEIGAGCFRLPDAETTPEGPFPMEDAHSASTARMERVNRPHSASTALMERQPSSWLRMSAPNSWPCLSPYFILTIGLMALPALESSNAWLISLKS